MNFLKNMKIGRRLGLAFGALLAMLGAVAVIGALQIGRVHGNVQYFAENTVPSLKAIQGYAADLSTVRRLEIQHVFVASQGARNDYEKRMAESRKSLEQGLENYRSLISDDEDKARWERARAAVSNYLALGDRVRQAALASSDPAAAANAQSLLLGESRSAFTEATASIEQMWVYNEGLGEKMAKQSKAAYVLALTLLGAATMCSIVLCIVAAVVITRSITRPIQSASDALRRMASGDLGTSVSAESRDETGEMIESLRAMQVNLVRVIGTVREGSDSVATASSEIAQGNSDLSQRTEQQASSLQQTAASMEELDSTVKQNDENARQAHQLAQGATEVAQKGGDVVTQVVDTMKEIDESSRKIGDIISVIDGIAFQTNILALNAAVEAARAGEQGRGFAVVAGEVRSLAQRCAEAAKDVKTLIGASVERVARGTSLVDEAGRTMQNIVLSVRRVSDIVGEISAASTEQASGISQIGEAVTHMDQVTQQNAALVEQSAAAAESLKQQAHQLAEAVSVFRLATESQNSTASPRASAPAAPRQTARSVPAKADAISKPAMANDDAWATF